MTVDSFVLLRKTKASIGVIIVVSIYLFKIIRLKTLFLKKI